MMTYIHSAARKTTRRILAGSIATVCAAAMFSAPTAQAATYYWDTNDGTAGFGTAGGTWSATTTGTATEGWSLNATGATVVSGNSVTTANTTNATDAVNFGTATSGLLGGTIAVSGTVSAGDITFGAASGLIVLSGGTITLAPAATITVNNATDTINSILAGAGTSLTKAGTGTLLLTGANTYTGTTIINGGRLTVGDSSTGSLNGTTGTALTFTNTGTFNVAEAAGSTQGMGALTFTAGDASIISTAATASSLATLTFASMGVRSPGATENFTLATNTTLGQNKILLTNSTNAPLTGSGSNGRGVFFGGTEYARYDAADGFRAVIYGTDSNASPLVGTGSTIVINDVTQDVKITGAITAQTTTSVNTLHLGNFAFTFSNAANVLSVNGILATGSLSMLNTTTVSFIQAGSSGGELVIRVDAGTLGVGQIIQNNTSASALTKSGAGTLSLSQLNTYTGTTFINGGNLRVGGGGYLGTAAYAGNMFIAGGATFTYGSSATQALSGIISGTGSLIKDTSTTSVLTLSGANTYSGGTTLNAGTIAISNATSLGSGSVSVTTGAGGSTINATGSISYANAINVGAALSLKNITATASTATFSGVLSGASNITLLVQGVNNINGIFAFTNPSNTFTGNVILPTSGSGNDFFSFNSIGDAGNFTIQKNGNREGIIYAGSSHIVFGTRQITLGTTITGGNFDGNGNPINSFANNGGGTVTFNSNMGVTTVTGASTLWFDGSNAGNNTFAGIIANPTSGGALTIGKTGAGTWLLSNAANAYAGSTFISQGTLSVNAIDIIANAQPLGKGSAVILGHAGAGTLIFTGATNSTTDKQVQVGFTTAANTNGGSILNNGTGSLTFSNAAFNPAIAGITATRTLTLGGNYTGSNGANGITGAIQNNAAAGLVALTVSGSVWNLSGINTYTGATTISGGLLRINNNSNTIASAVGVSAGGALGGTGTVPGAVTVAVGTATAPGGVINLVDGTAGQTLTLSSTLTFNGTTANPNNLYFDLGSGATGTDKILLSTAAAVPVITTPGTGAVLINVNQLAGSPTAGNYTIIQGGTGANFAATLTNYALATTRAGGNVYSLVNTTADLLQVGVAAGTAGSATAFWNSTASTSWGAANWQQTATGGGVATPGFSTDVTFSSTTPTATALTTTLDADFEIKSLTFATPLTGTNSIGGTNMLTINSAAGITSSNTSGTNTIAAKVGLGASQTWTVASGGTLAVSGAITDFGGGFGLTKAGTGSLNLSATSTYSGLTTISAGILRLDTATGLLPNTSGVSITSGASLFLRNVTTATFGSGQSLTLNGTGATGTGALVVSTTGTTTWNGPVSLGSDSLVLAGGGTVLNINGAINLGSFTLTTNTAGSTFSNIISGTGGLTKTGTGTLVLSAVNSYDGTTSILNGQIQISAATALGSTVGNTIVSSGAGLRLNAAMTLAENLTLSGTGTGALTNTYGALLLAASSGTFTLNGAITLSGGAALNTYNSGTANVTIAQGIGGTGDLTLRASAANNGGGVYILNGASSYTGETILSTLATDATGVTVRNGVDNALPITTVLRLQAAANGVVNVTSPAKYQLNGKIQEVAGITGGAAIVATASVSGLLNSIIGGSATLSTLTVNNPTIPYIYDGRLGNITPNENNLALVKSGAGSLTLTDANTYTGGTSIYAGTLIARNTTALGTGAVSVAANAGLVYNAASNVTLNLGGTLTLNGGTSTLLGTSVGTTASSAKIAVTGVVAATGAIKVDIYGATGVTHFGGGVTTLLTGAGGSTVNGATYTLGNVYNNTDFSVTAGTLTATATDLTVTTAAVSALGSAYWTGGLSGNSNVWAVSSGSVSNWLDSTGTASALVPGSGADVFISSRNLSTPITPNTNPTATVLGADMTIKSLTIADTTSGLGLNATIEGYTLTIANAAGITMSASVPASTIATKVGLGTDQTWTNNSLNTLTVSGAVSGAFALTKAGAGPLTLSGANTYTGITTINGGTLSANTVADAGSSSIGLSALANALTFGSGGGTLNFSGTTGTTTRAIAFTGAGVFDIDGGSTLTVGTTTATPTTTNGLWSGSGGVTKSGSGTLTVRNNSSSAVDRFTVDSLHGGNFTMSGGILNITPTKFFTISETGSSGTSTFTQSAGTVNFTPANTAANDVYIGGVGGTAGLLNVTGGSFNVTTSLSQIRVGGSSTGTLSVGGGAGTATVDSPTIAVGVGAGSGVVNLYANGVILTSALKDGGGAGTSTVNFDGGTLKAKTSSGALFMPTGFDTAAITSNGLTVDTNTFDVTIGQALSGAGGLTKTNTGTLTLSGAQNYNQLTTSGGVTNVSGAFTGGTATVNANATTNFSTSQTLAALNIGAGAVVALTATPPFAPFAGEALSGPSSAVVPEPGSIGLLLVGSLGLLARRRRQA